MSRYPALLTLCLLGLCAAIIAGCSAGSPGQPPTARPLATLPVAARTAAAATRDAVATSEFLARLSSAGARPTMTAGEATVQPGTGQPAAGLAPPANAAIPAGWQRHTTAELSVALPDHWQALEPTAENLQALYDEAQKNNPQLAALLGSAQALQGVSLWAFDMEALGQPFVHNLNIRRQSLAGQKIADMQQVVSQLAGQYDQIGGNILESKTGLRIGGHPAARITYTLPMNDANGKPMQLQGYQYLVLADDLWVLTYSTSSEEAARLVPIFDNSAATFQVLR